MAIELQRRAAEQFLFSGYIDKGLMSLRVVLKLLGLSLPETLWSSVIPLLFWRMVLRLRGIKYQQRTEEEISGDQLLRIDTYGAVALGLGQVDTVRGAYYQTQYLLMALRAGEPFRISRALATEICYYAAVGGRNYRRVEELRDVAVGLAEQIERPTAIGLTKLALGFDAFSRGDWPKALDFSDQAEEILRTHGKDVTLELDTAQYYSLCALQHMGRLRQVFERLPILLKEAQERGDLYLETLLSARYSYLSFLCQDDVERAQADLKYAMGRWSRDGFHHQHYLEMSSQTHIHLYGCQGQGTAAWQYFSERWSQLRDSLFIMVKVVRIEALHTRGRAALAAAAGAASTAEARSYLRAARRAALRIMRERNQWGMPFVDLIEAGISAFNGRYDKAIKRLQRAEARFEQVNMSLYQAGVRHRRGELIGGEEGRALIESANAALLAEQIKHPARMTAMLVPGKWRKRED